MLELICDHRSGTRMEIVIPTFNEEKRLGNILGYYGQEFDIVLLDDGSTDNTLDLAKKSGATIYRRVGVGYSEMHFAHYVNELTKSGYCFLMFMDEFIRKSDLREVYARLQAQDCIVMGRRIDWAYGYRLNNIFGFSPRGFARGEAVYDPTSIHASLKHIRERDKKSPRLFFDVHHLSLYSMRDYFCKASAYMYDEISLFRQSNKPLTKYLRRFVGYELIKLPLRLARELKVNKNIPFLLWSMFISLTVFCLSVLIWLEQGYFIGVDEELAFYATFYQDEPQGPAPEQQ